MAMCCLCTRNFEENITFATLNFSSLSVVLCECKKISAHLLEGDFHGLMEVLYHILCEEEWKELTMLQIRISTIISSNKTELKYLKNLNELF